MRTNPIDRVRDPFYAELVYTVERTILQADRSAKAASIRLTDSQIRSALNKARKVVAGESPSIPTETPREELLAGLIENIVALRSGLAIRPAHEGAAEPIEPADERAMIAGVVTNTIETVETLVANRESDTPGSRDYLEFLSSFVRKPEKQLEQ